ncbi:MAG: type II toxin-antitoxin system Phd/YefM family antitoxin [Clostridiales bacterium]|jgi:PHD/YefM family antitoxin component YafN of YafNO toxin-antitoxin module|nr:type II toxin-antitoxin system Phd/YefM family antitoxin [Clostridiales bacterium]
MSEAAVKSSVSVPIARFMNGEAARVFQEVEEEGTKIVMDNGDPKCVLMTPEEYVRMKDEIEDRKLIDLVIERIDNDTGVTYSEKEVLEELGITEEDLAAIDDSEIEIG